MGEGGEFPSAHVPSQEQHALASFGGAFEILKPVIGDDFADVLASVTRKKTDLPELATQGSEHATHNLAPLAHAFLRKRHLQIAQADAPQLAVEKIDEPSDGDADRPRRRPRKHTNGFHDAPHQRVLEPKTHQGEPV
jgi:hypothetical protein